MARKAVAQTRQYQMIELIANLVNFKEDIEENYIPRQRKDIQELEDMLPGHPRAGDIERLLVKHKDDLKDAEMALEVFALNVNE